MLSGRDESLCMLGYFIECFLWCICKYLKSYLMWFNLKFRINIINVFRVDLSLNFGLRVKWFCGKVNLI